MTRNRARSVFMADRRTTGIDRFRCDHCPATPLPLFGNGESSSYGDPHVRASFEYAHIPAPATLSPIMCKLYYFYPKYISPLAPCHGLRGQQVKLHMSTESHPRHARARHPSGPPPWASLFAESHVYSRFGSQDPAERRSGELTEVLGTGNSAGSRLFFRGKSEVRLESGIVCWVMWKRVQECCDVRLQLDNRRVEMVNDGRVTEEKILFSHTAMLVLMLSISQQP